MNDKIRKAIQNNTLIIDYIAGAGNLSYKISFYRNIQCRYHVLLDNDEAGRRAGQEAEAQGLLTIRNITYTLCNGSPNAELEDCYNIDAYEQAIRDEYGVNLNVREFRGNDKWSDRIAACFRSQGKQWGDAVEKKVKFTVANSIPSNPDVVLNPHKRTSIDALVTALETMLT
jgi:putative ATP-dependent endonuclease of OLD family